MRRAKKIQPKPFYVYFIPVLLLALAGLGDSIYLSISHYRVYTDISYKSFCAISKAINCDTVSQSPYAIMLGIPVPVWGVIGYFFLTMLLVFAGNDRRKEKSGWTLLMSIAAIFSFYSIILALISNYLIHSYCIMCIVSYVINFALLFMCWLIRRRFCNDPFWWGLLEDGLFFVGTRYRLILLSGLGAVVFALFAWFPAYWDVGDVQLNYDVPSGLTAEGHPWIGATDPELVIEEYTDYLCFQCRKMHFYLRDLIEAHPGKIRLVHRHFPMDAQFNPVVKEQFHGGAGSMALLAIYAMSKGKFWETNDVLFKTSRTDFNVRTIAHAVNLPATEMALSLRDKRIRAFLARDIRAGMALGLTGTPAYVINGNVYESIIPPDILKQVLD